MTHSMGRLMQHTIRKEKLISSRISARRRFAHRLATREAITVPTDVLTITSADVEKLTRGQLTPVEVTFAEMAGKKVRLRILVERTSAGEFRLGNITLTANGDTEGISHMDANSQHRHTTYSLHGIPTDTPTKGLYVRDGKKVIIK